MNKKNTIYLIIAILFLFSSISISFAQEWGLIGQVKVKKQGNNVDIAITNRVFHYKELKVGVQNGPIKIIKIIAFPVDGEAYEVEVQNYIQPGETTPSIFLSEKGLALTKIQIIYYTKKHVTIELYGK
jgi:hypothetical protein